MSDVPPIRLSDVTQKEESRRKDGAQLSQGADRATFHATCPQTKGPPAPTPRGDCFEETPRDRDRRTARVPRGPGCGLWCAVISGVTKASSRGRSPRAEHPWEDRFARGGVQTHPPQNKGSGEGFIIWGGGLPSWLAVSHQELWSICCTCCPKRVPFVLLRVLGASRNDLDRGLQRWPGRRVGSGTSRRRSGHPGGRSDGGMLPNRRTACGNSRVGNVRVGNERKQGLVRGVCRLGKKRNIAPPEKLSTNNFGRTGILDNFGG